MRYRDARHIDLKSFHARRPVLGAVFRFVAYGAVAVVPVLVHFEAVAGLRIMLAGAVLWWLLAWYACVGSSWRTATVCAALLSASCLALVKLGVLA